MVELSEITTAYYMIAATGVLVAAVYYIMNLRNTEKSRKRDWIFQQLNINRREHYKIFLDVTMMTDWDTLEDFTRKYNKWSNPEAIANLLYLISHYNSLGILLKDGIIEVDELYNLYAPSSIVSIYENFLPYLMQFEHEYMSGFKYLYDLTKRRYPGKKWSRLTRSLEEQLENYRSRELIQ
ncbi:hypothetical protein FJY84_02710 [Candidatus Bathyarchaeota archaeon]|nr:hypothetical protein [Candidatus Bathyarchaeota archaeon]